MVGGGQCEGWAKTDCRHIGGINFDLTPSSPEQQREGDTGHGRRARHGAQRRRVFVHFRSWASAVAFCAVKPKIDSCGLAPMLVGNTDPSITDRLASW